MGTEQLILHYSPVGDMISFVIGMLMMFLITKVLYFTKDRNFTLLKIALHCIMLGAESNIVFYLVVSRLGSIPWAIFLIRDIYHISLLVCLYCFILYMKRMLDVKGVGVNTFSYVSRGLVSVCLLLDICSPFTGFGLHLEDGRWQDPIVSAYNIFYVYAVICFLVMFAFYAKRLIRAVRHCLIATELIIILIMILQATFNINTFTSFTYVLPVLVVLILLHSKPFDEKTGSLDARSFSNFIQQVSEKGISLDYMVLKLEVGDLGKVSGELGKVLNSFWHQSFRNALLFHMADDLFALVVPRDKKNGNTKEKINSLIQNLFGTYYERFRIPYKLIVMYDIDFVNRASDFWGIIKYLLEITHENSCYVVDDNKRKELRMFKAIREHLDDIEEGNDLNDERVLVYCQPIRNMKTGKYDTAEALMRLNLPDAGFIMPGMFISLAESYEHIHCLTKIMLNKVCKQIKELEQEGYQFKRISVNIAASEVREDNFCEEILGIITRNGVNPSKIGIELTESQTERDFMILKEKMKQLRNEGITLYLDDVGTGYSNLDRIVRYDVDVVKFDRFFLLEAEKNLKIQKMLSHLSQAFQDLDYQLLYEGVETEEHESLCMNCGADYIQGFKYSKPVPMEELRNFFENH